MKTYNRGKLLRLAQAGKLECVDSYHFDDMHGASETSTTRPVKVIDSTADGRNRPDGTVCLFTTDFKSKSGCAYESGPGLVTLIVHSNLNFTFKVKGGVPCPAN